MLVKRIKTFINDLKAKCTLPIDIKLFEQLLVYFELKDPDSVLSNDDLRFVEDQFAQRCAAIKLNSFDYTLHQGEVNQLWLALAKEFCSSVGKTYVQILYPDIKNIHDPINFNLLEKVENIDNLYLGSAGRVLYWKLGLCELLVNNLRAFYKSELTGSSVLATRRLRDSNESLTLTVDELARLKASPVRKIKVKIDANKSMEDFSSFWEFLNTRVFPTLNQKNDLPLSLMSYFLPLIGQYFELKETVPFAVFKKELNNFLNHLQRHDPDEINQFYGLHFVLDGTKYYLIDFLIDFANAKEYNLDANLKSLVNVLYCLNSGLFLKNKAVRLFYPPEVLASEMMTPDTLSQYRLFILSVFTRYFSPSFWDNTSVSIFDIEVGVPDEIFKIYQRFHSAIAKNDENEMARVYAKVVEDAADKEETSFWASLFCMDLSHFSQWLKSEHAVGAGLQWYHPKLILHALVSFHASTSKAEVLVENFFDQIMETYCQNSSISKFAKQARINILLIKLLEQLNKQGLAGDSKALIQLLDICAKEDYLSPFIGNCIYSIGLRLENIKAKHLDGGGLTFFAGSQVVGRVRSKFVGDEFTSVNDIVMKYRSDIAERKLPELTKRAMYGYLDSCQVPLLTCDEEREIERNVPVEVYIRR